MLSGTVGRLAGFSNQVQWAAAGSAVNDLESWMLRSVLIAAAAGASLAACDRGAGGPAPDAHPILTVPTPANEAGAADFVAKTGAQDLFQIAAARIALQRSGDPRVRQYAAAQLHDHQAAATRLRAALAGHTPPVAPPATLPESHQDRIEDLTKAQVADFDRTYLAVQLDMLQANLNLMARYARDGDVAALRDLAARAALLAQDRYDQAQALRDALA